MIKNLRGLFSRMFLKVFLFLFSCISISFSFCQVKFSASVSDRTISKNDYLQIQFTVENGGNVEGISPPSFKNFTIVSGPNQQSSMSNINGRITQSIAIGFVLKPLSTGNFTIGSATAKVDGKEYYSNQVSVEVNNSPSTAHGNTGTQTSPFGNMLLDMPSEPATHQFDDYILRKGENVAEKIKKNLFIKIDVNKTSCFVGEPLVATYKLFTRLKSESNVLKTPSFNGFSVSELEMPDNNSLKIEKYNGREYNVYTLRKVQLYPLQSGVLSLEPIEVKNTINFLKAEYAGKRNGDIFYDMLRNFADETAPGNATDQQTVTLSCPPLNITVKPLPDANKPASFKGAVGNYTINAGVEKNTITTDDAGSLKIIIEGAGNIQLVNAPGVTWPKGLEGFESKSSERLDNFSVPIKGEKIFTYPFTADHAGNYTIPAIDFSYFDVKTQSYKTLTTKPLELNVEKGNGHPNIANLHSENKKNTTSFIDLLANNQLSLLAAAVVVAVFIILLRKKKGSVTPTIVNKVSNKTYQQDPVEEAAFNIPINPLAEAEAKLSEGNAGFYKALNICLQNYLSNKLKVPVEELSRKKINERMDRCNVGVGTTLLVNSLLADIELNVYAPASTATQMHKMYEKANEVISLLDKQIC